MFGPTFRAALVVLACFAGTGCRSVGDAAASKGSARTCLTENSLFPEAWACIRARHPAGQDGNGADPKLAGFLAKGDRLAEQVADGLMSNVEARNEISADLKRDLGE